MAAHPDKDLPVAGKASSKQKKPATPLLTEHELAARVTLGSPKLVEELWNISQKQLDIEIARHTRLDTKATSLLTAAGLSLTVAFTFGSTLLTKADAFKEYHEQVVAIFAVTIIAGLVSAFL